jgi:signal transduction histidine kinase
MQVPENNIIQIVFLITGIFLLAAIFLLFYVNLYNERKKKHIEEKSNMKREFEKQLMQSQLEVQEYTLGVLSQELHDNIGQLLSSTKMLLGVTERTLPQVPDSFKTATETLSKAILDLRSLSKSFSQEWLHQFNLIENLQSEVDRLLSSQQIGVQLETQITNLPLEPSEQVILFRVLQEALQNAIKHAQATEIRIAILIVGEMLQLDITDNGPGFDMNTVHRSGVGIMNMKHRIKLLNGTIEWQSNTPTGTKVFISLPFLNHAS